MEKLFKIIETIIGVLKFIPDFLLPRALKGWRTIVFNAVAGLLAILETLDVVEIVDKTCQFLNQFGVDGCTSEGVGAVYTSIIALMNVILRASTDTKVGKKA